MSGWIEKRGTNKRTGKTRWRARYRGADGRERSRTFDRKPDAQAWLQARMAEVATGDWVAPERSRQPFGAYAERWLETHTGQQSTIAGYRSVLDHRVLPRFGGRPVASIERPEIRSFVAEMVDEGVSPGTARNNLNVVKAVLTFTVEAGGLRASPAAGVSAPKGEQHRLNIPSIEQVHALVESIDSQYRMVVLVAAYGGLRAGELHALEVHDIDTMRGRIHVRRSVSEVHGKLHYGPPKWGRTRTVTLPPSVCDELVVHLVPVADDPDALAFTTAAGAPIRQSNFYRRHFRPTADAIGLGCTFHDLRHFCVASLIAAGAHPRAIMERMGHSSITVTLDTYGHLFPALDEALTDALDAQFSEAAADALRPTRGLVAPAVPFRNGTETSEKAL